jgi:anti-sigma B factor antagonist
MPLVIDRKHDEGITIFDLKGKLTLGEEDLYFRGALEKCVQAGNTRLVINLSGVDEIDSTGVSTLLYTLALLRSAHGGLALVNVKPSHAAMLAEARLAALFDVFKTEQDAINSFFPERETHRYDLLAFIRSLHAGSAAPFAAP